MVDNEHTCFISLLQNSQKQEWKESKNLFLKFLTTKAWMIKVPSPGFQCVAGTVGRRPGKESRFVQLVVYFHAAMNFTIIARILSIILLPLFVALSVSAQNNKVDHPVSANAVATS